MMNNDVRTMTTALFNMFIVCTYQYAIINANKYGVIVRRASFVDKTEYIASILKEKGYLLFTAPPKFGKTTILTTIKTFLEIEVSECGQPITRTSTPAQPITDTPNFKLLFNHNLSIVKDNNMMYNYLGKIPVIQVDLRLPEDVKVTQLYHAVRLCKNFIHDSFKEHEYLACSERLTEDQRQYVKIWCESHSYKTIVDFSYVSHGLQSLAQYLYQHFKGRKVFFLFDNYDSIIQSASRNVSDKTELDAIMNYVFQIISDVTKGSREFLRGVVVTGVSEVSRCYESHLTNFTTYSFRGKNKYSGMWFKTK